jgi:quercetin dioxygenase-like cupin family protein
MKISRRVTVQFASILFGVVVVIAGPLYAQYHHIVVPPDKVQWQPAPPVLPAGAQIAVLEGNPAEKGPITMRLKFPANYVVPPHWHSMTEHLTVLSGTFYVGAGDTVDRAASQALQTDGFVSMPAKMHHYAWVKSPTVVQINLDGPFDLFYVNASDDPQKKSTSLATRP